MRRFLSTLARVLFGFVLASLAAGLVTVLFVTTPVEVLNEPFERLPKTASETFDLALLAATHLGIFASVFVIIVALLSEVFSVRSLTFYLFAGIAIAMLGFTAQYQSGVAGQPTILNNYAIKAFLTIGFFGGFFYWLAAGQFAGRPYGWGQAVTAEPLPVEAVPPAREAENDAEVVITRPPVAIEQARPRKPLLQRLKFSRRSVTQDPAADSATREPSGTPEDTSRNSLSLIHI